ncbi:MAG: flap endonuclease-1 [Nanobdellota archaeon]
MGVSLRQIITGKECSLEELGGSVIAVDAMNMIYQFATTIRQHDGTPLKDSHGNITSHLTGLFSRISRLLRHDLKLVFVFDGQMPDLKSKERERRESLKKKALTALKEAESVKDLEGMKKYASRTTKVTTEMVEESKELLSAMGIPCLTAPSEGEAQGARMVHEADCQYVASQDFDCLIYGAPRVIRNLSIGQKRKKINAVTYKQIKPEILDLTAVLEELDISLEQLQVLAILIGTDFNYGGVKGIGPKKGLDLVKKYKDNYEELFEHVKWDEQWTISWKDVLATIQDMKTTKEYSLEWNDFDKEKITALLVDKHDFSKERVLSTIEDIEKEKKKARQTSLGNFFS